MALCLCLVACTCALCTAHVIYLYIFMQPCLACSCQLLVINCIVRMPRALAPIKASAQ